MSGNLCGCLYTATGKIIQKISWKYTSELQRNFSGSLCASSAAPHVLPFLHLQFMDMLYGSAVTFTWPSRPVNAREIFTFQALSKATLLYSWHFTIFIPSNKT